MCMGVQRTKDLEEDREGAIREGDETPEECYLLLKWKWGTRFLTEGEEGWWWDS